MKKLVSLAAIAAVLFAGAVSAGMLRQWSVTSTAASPVTGSAPSDDCVEGETGDPKITGLNLAGCKAVYLCSEIVAGTHSGGGTAEAYFWDLKMSDWAREKEADQLYDAEASGEQEFCWPAREVPGGTGYGCGFWVPVGVTYGGGGSAVKLTAKCIN